MSKNRRLPREGCSLPCKIIIDGRCILGDVVDISGDGFAFIPVDKNINIAVGGVGEVEIKYSDHDISGIPIKTTAELVWCEGLMMGFRLVDQTRSSYKKWIFILAKTFK